MKKFISVITAIFASLSFSLTALAAPIINSVGGQISIPQIDYSAAIESAIMSNLSCSMNASIRFVDTTHNTVTYSIDYTNSNDYIVKKPYGIQAGTNLELLINAKGEATLAKGTAKMTLPSGKTVGTFSVNPKLVSTVSFNGNINGKKCTSRELNVLKTKPFSISTSLTPDLGNIQFNGNSATTNVVQVPQASANANSNSGVVAVDSNVVSPVNNNQTCKVIAEGALKGTSVLMGAAIDYDGFDAKSFSFTLRGYSESKPNDVREYNGNQQLSNGHNYLLNSDQRGFLFELPLSDVPETYVITATLGEKTCALASFAIPSATAQVQAQDSGAAGSPVVNSQAQANSTVEVFGNSPQDAQTAAQLALAQNATKSGAKDSNSSAMSNTLLVLGGIALAAAAFGLYKKFGVKKA